jgi:hypothetical protein
VTLRSVGPGPVPAAAAFLVRPDPRIISELKPSFVRRDGVAPPAGVRQERSVRRRCPRPGGRAPVALGPDDTQRDTGRMSLSRQDWCQDSGSLLVLQSGAGLVAGVLPAVVTPVVHVLAAPPVRSARD